MLTNPSVGKRFARNGPRPSWPAGRWHASADQGVPAVLNPLGRISGATPAYLNPALPGFLSGDNVGPPLEASPTPTPFPAGAGSRTRRQAPRMSDRRNRRTMHARFHCSGYHKTAAPGTDCVFRGIPANDSAASRPPPVRGRVLTRVRLTMISTSVAIRGRRFGAHRPHLKHMGLALTHHPAHTTAGSHPAGVVIGMNSTAGRADLVFCPRRSNAAHAHRRGKKASSDPLHARVRIPIAELERNVIRHLGHALGRAFRNGPWTGMRLLY